MNFVGMESSDGVFAPLDVKEHVGLIVGPFERFCVIVPYCNRQHASGGILEGQLASPMFRNLRLIDLHHLVRFI